MAPCSAISQSGGAAQEAFYSQDSTEYETRNMRIGVKQMLNQAGAFGKEAVLKMQGYSEANLRERKQAL